MFINLSIYQIILALISLLFLTNGFLKFIKRENNQTVFKFISIIIIWGGILLFTIFPNATRIISVKLGMGENLNTLIFIAFVFIFIIIFKLLNIIERLEKNISEIVRKEALKDLKNKIKNGIYEK